MKRHTKHFWWLLNLGPGSAWTPRLAFDVLVGLEMREVDDGQVMMVLEDFFGWPLESRVGKN